jgi:hypothetical protein
MCNSNQMSLGILTPGREKIARRPTVILALGSSSPSAWRFFAGTAEQLEWSNFKNEAAKH